MVEVLLVLGGAAGQQRVAVGLAGSLSLRLALDLRVEARDVDYLCLAESPFPSLHALDWEKLFRSLLGSFQPLRTSEDVVVCTEPAEVPLCTVRNRNETVASSRIAPAGAGTADAVHQSCPHTPVKKRKLRRSQTHARAGGT
jgi:hypothetical protein